MREAQAKKVTIARPPATIEIIVTASQPCPEVAGRIAIPAVVVVAPNIRTVFPEPEDMLTPKICN
jgi:hypothetical protein